MEYATSLQTVRALSRKLLNLACLCLAVASLLGPGVVAVRAATTQVHVFDFDFSANPEGQSIADPTINLGDTIQWVWDAGTSPHSTTSAGGQAESWDSGVLSAGNQFDHTFNNIGTFNYYCIPHGVDLGGGNVDGMSGSITVVPEPSTWALGLIGLALTWSFLACRRATRHDLEQTGERLGTR